MIVIPPLAITASILTSTTVAALMAPAAWAIGTTYVFGDIKKDASNIVYQSLQNNNTGNAPSASPLFWERIGYNEVAYSAVATYAIGDYVASGTRVYKGLTASNTGNTPLTSPVNWLDVGPINQWAMFDLLRNTASVAAGTQTFVLTPGLRCDTLGFVGVVADTIRVQVSSLGVTYYDQTKTLSVSSYIGNWYDFFFATFTQKNTSLFTNLTPYTNMIITITIARASGNVKVGSLVLGNANDMGAIQYNPKNTATNYSRIVRNDYGEASLTPRRSVPRSSQVSWLAKEKVQALLNLRDNVLNGAPALYCGLTDVDHSYFDPLLVLGVYKQLDADLSYTNIAQITSEIEEL